MDIMLGIFQQANLVIYHSFENAQSLDELGISGGSTENNEIIELLNKLLGEISSVKKMNIENNHILNEIGKRFYNIGNSKFDINDEQD